MLTVLKILAIFQGFVLLFLFYENRKRYNPSSLWFLLAAIATMLLYIVGDNSNIFIFRYLDNHLFDYSIFITFIYLFVRHSVNVDNTFSKKSLLYLIPNVLYFGVMLVQNNSEQSSFVTDNIQAFIQCIFMFYLGHTIYTLLTNNVQKWMMYMLIPMLSLIGMFFLKEMVLFVGFSELVIFNDPYLVTCLLLLNSFFLFGISIRLIVTPNESMPGITSDNYHTKVFIK